VASNKTATLDAKALANLKATLKREALIKAQAEIEAKRLMANKAISPEIPDDTTLFKEAVKDARPITAPPIYLYQKNPNPFQSSLFKTNNKRYVTLCLMTIYLHMN